MPDDNQLIIQGISKSFGSNEVLNKVSLTSTGNEVIGLLGRNGAGKTTLLRIIAGLLDPDEGEVMLGNMRSGSLPFSREVTYLSERNALYPHLKVGEYLFWIGQLFNLQDLKDRIWQVVDQIDISDIFDQKIETLSKGLKQRVGLAAAMVPDPQVMILDEPVSGLDPVQILQLRKVIRVLGRHKIIILSSHLMQEIEQLCDRIVLIDEHEIRMDAPIQTVLSGSRRQKLMVTFKRGGQKADLEKLPWVDKVIDQENGRYEIWSDKQGDFREQLFDHSVTQSWKILEMTEKQNPLDDLFEND